MTGQFEMTVNIRIVGTEKDAKLLKKIIKQYAEQTKSEVEKGNCECYIGLIECAQKRAEEHAK